MEDEPFSIEAMVESMLTGRKRGVQRDKAAYLRHYRRRLTLAAVQRFQWLNVGEHIESRFVETTLMQRGLGVFYMQQAGEVADGGGDGVLEEPRLTFRQAAQGGRLTDQWVTSEYRTIAPGGPTRLIRTAGTLDCWDGIPVYENTMHDAYISDAIRFHANRLAEASLTVDVNLSNTRTQRIAVLDQDQVKSAQMVDDMLASGNGTALLKTKNGESIADQFSVLDLGVDPRTVETNHGVFVRLLGEAYNALGVKAEANEKEAQQTVAEVNSDDTMIASIRLASFDARRWAVDKLNKRYGLEASVIDTGTGGF